MKSTTHHNVTEKQALRLYPEVATLLGLGRTAVYQAARRGEIPTIKIGKLRLVPRKALERLLDVGEPPAATGGADAR